MTTPDESPPGETRSVRRERLEERARAQAGVISRQELYAAGLTRGEVRAQHTWAEHLVGDALRHNRIAIDGDVVLRMPVLGLRVCPDDFFDQVRTSLRRAGWHVLPKSA